MLESEYLRSIVRVLACGDESESCEECEGQREESNGLKDQNKVFRQYDLVMMLLTTLRHF